MKLTHKISLATMMLALLTAGVMLFGGIHAAKASDPYNPHGTVSPSNGIQGKDGWSSSKEWQVKVDTSQFEGRKGIGKVCAQLSGDGAGPECHSIGTGNGDNNGSPVMMSSEGTITFHANVSNGDAKNHTPGTPGTYVGYVWLTNSDIINPIQYPKQTVEYKYDNVQPEAPQAVHSAEITEGTSSTVSWTGPTNKPISGIEGYRYQLDNKKEADSTSKRYFTSNAQANLTPEQVKHALDGQRAGTVYLHVQSVSGALINSATTTTSAIKVNEAPVHPSANGSAPASPGSSAAISVAKKRGSVKVISHKIKLNRKGKGKIKVKCEAGTTGCKGKIALRAKVKKNRKILVATVPYNLSSGSVKTIRFKANKKARKALAKQGNKAKVVTVINGTATITSQ